MTGRIRGWCPGALRPMQAADGLLVRVRPRACRLSASEALTLADLSEAYGSGLIDLGSRASLQLRGVSNEGLHVLRRGLAWLNLLDDDVMHEARRNILTSPIAEDAETLRLVEELEAALATGPKLPPKFGFAIDTGTQAILGTASADIRIERGEGSLILRADGMSLGLPVTAETAVARAMDLARWFVEKAGLYRRMAPLIASGARPPMMATLAPRSGAPLLPGERSEGTCVALPFGRMTAAMLRALAVGPLRLTPWRSVLVAAQIPPAECWIIHPDDPRLWVSACPGRSGCASASVETRALATRLTHRLSPGETLHVSGCAKGCAHPGATTLTLTGREGRFDLIHQGRADDPPLLTDLFPQDIPDLLRGPLAPPL